jgi:hypothetical protein
MVDYFAIVVTHGVMALALWRLLQRDDLDQEGADESPRRKPGRPADV